MIWCRWCRWCRAAASSGRRVVLVCCWPPWSSSGRRRRCKAQAARHHRAGRPRRARPGQKEKAQGGGAGCARVALGLCRRCWSAAGRRGHHRGGAGDARRRRRGIIGQAAHVERGQGKKKKPRAAAQVVRVSLWACVVGAGLLLIRQGHGGAVLPFAGGVRFSTLPGSALCVGLELSEL